MLGVAVGDCTLRALKVELGDHTYVTPVPTPGVADKGTGPGVQIVLLGVMVRVSAGFTCTCTESRYVQPAVGSVAFSLNQPDADGVAVVDADAELLSVPGPVQA